MATKKPTAKQLAARANFTKMAKSGELKKLADKSKKAKGLNAPAGLRTMCAKAYSTTGLRKKDGTQKKGFIVKKGGKIVKIAKKPVAKKN